MNTPQPMSADERRRAKERLRKKLTQIRALLAKAESESNSADGDEAIEAEREALRERAFDLMAKYGIEAHMHRSDSAKPGPLRFAIIVPKPSAVPDAALSSCG